VGVERCERLYHLTTAVDVLALLGRCSPRVLDEAKALDTVVGSGMPL
jgi:hypothetical protein